MPTLDQRKVIERSRRLARLVALNAPDVLVNRELGMVLEAAADCGYTATAISEELLEGEEG